MSPPERTPDHEKSAPSNRRPIEGHREEHISLILPVVGHKVTPMTPDQLLSWISTQTSAAGKTVITNHNLHSLYMMETAEDFAKLYARASVVLIDGYPVLKLAQIAAPRQLTSAHRIGSLDWVLRLGESSGVKRLAVVGSGQKSNTLAVERLIATSPDLIVRGWPGENWSAALSHKITSELNTFSPDVVLVGLGMPLQENFLIQAWNRLPDGIYATVGGVIDQIACVQKPAPRWLGGFGLEWLWRFMTQPRRLAKRYFLEPWLLALALYRKRLL